MSDGGWTPDSLDRYQANKRKEDEDSRLRARLVAEARIKAGGKGKKSGKSLKEEEESIDRFIATRNDPLYKKAGEAIGINRYNKPNEYSRIVDYLAKGGQQQQAAPAAKPEDPKPQSAQPTRFLDTPPPAPPSWSDAMAGGGSSRYGSRDTDTSGRFAAGAPQPSGGLPSSDMSPANDNLYGDIGRVGRANQAQVSRAADFFGQYATRQGWEIGNANLALINSLPNTLPDVKNALSEKSANEYNLFYKRVKV